VIDDVPPLLVLQARAEARAILYAAGEYESIEEAFAPLLQHALDNGLVDEIGADTVYNIASKPFGEHFACWASLPTE
jgi:hypothetical protein